jgi:hypothetical protein
MGLYETYRNPEFRKRTMKIATLEFKDYPDFWNKYGRETNPDYWAEWFSVAAYFNGIGVLVKRGLVDIDLVEELLVNVIERSWSKMGGVILWWRENVATIPDRKYTHLHGFEYLFHELAKRDPKLLSHTNR